MFVFEECVCVCMYLCVCVCGVVGVGGLGDAGRVGGRSEVFSAGFCG